MMFLTPFFVVPLLRVVQDLQSMAKETTALSKDFNVMVFIVGGGVSLLVLREVFSFLKTKDSGKKENGKTPCVEQPCMTLTIDKVGRNEEKLQEVRMILSRQTEILSSLAKSDICITETLEKISEFITNAPRARKNDDMIMHTLEGIDKFLASSLRKP